MPGWTGKGSRQSRGYGRQWEKLRAHILDRDHHLCQPCKAKGHITPASQVDHITPKAEGGTDDPANLQAICIPCHSAKTAEEAARAQGRKVRRKLEFDAAGFPVWPDEGK